MADIPLFPLPLVLFPGSKLTLQIFEPRYLDMVKHCMREELGFGIVMIRDGDQVLRLANQKLPLIAQCGTYCTIVDFDQRPNGLLQITIEGQVKFTVRDQYEKPDRLMMAGIEFLPLEEETPVPDDKRHLADLLVTLNSHEAVKVLDLKFDLDVSRDVGSKLSELLPCSNDFKQRMLEMMDLAARLVEIEAQLLKMQDNT